jgi:protein-disulfide isomerase
MKLKDILFLCCMGILAACALIFTGFMIKGRLFPATPVHSHHQPQQARSRQVANWRKLKLPGQRNGPPNTPVQIVEFFDYECPFCKASEPALKAIRAKYSQEKVAIVYINDPLQQIHPYAFGASIAAECALRQAPQAFMAYHDSLFARQKRLGHFSYTSLAAQTGIGDTTLFRQCIVQKKTAGILKAGKKLAGKLNIRGTPAFLVNGTLVIGEVSKQQLNGLVQDALAKAGK